MDDRIKALKQLKINAPGVFADLIVKRTNHLNKQIESLRMEYKSCTDEEEKKKIVSEANKLKRELKMYKDVQNG